MKRPIITLGSFSEKPSVSAIFAFNAMSASPVTPVSACSR